MSNKPRLLTSDELRVLLHMPAPDKGPVPPPCNNDIYSKGQTVGIFDLPKEKAEMICQKATEITGTPHDWFYFGGRAVIKCLLPKED